MDRPCELSSSDSPPLDTPVYLPLFLPDELYIFKAAARPAARPPPSTKGCQLGKAPLHRCLDIAADRATAASLSKRDIASYKRRGYAVANLAKTFVRISF